MKKNLTAADPEYVFWGECSNFIKEFYIPENNDAYWNKLYDAHKKLAEKYRDYPMCRNILVCVVDELERKAKCERKQN